jgi:hypothetical protein
VLLHQLLSTRPDVRAVGVNRQAYMCIPWVSQVVYYTLALRQSMAAWHLDYTPSLFFSLIECVTARVATSIMFSVKEQRQRRGLKMLRPQSSSPAHITTICAFRDNIMQTTNSATVNTTSADSVMLLFVGVCSRVFTMPSYPRSTAHARSRGSYNWMLTQMIAHCCQAAQVYSSVGTGLPNDSLILLLLHILN